MNFLKELFTTHWIINILLLATGCTNENGISHSAAINIQVGDAIVIPIDNRTSYKSYCVQYIENAGMPLLAYESREKNAIQFYHLLTKKLIHEVVFPRVGDKAIDELAGFFIADLNHIYIIGDQLRRLFIVDSLGNIDQVFSIDKSLISKENDFGTSGAISIFPAIKSENHLYVFAGPNFNIMEIPGEGKAFEMAISLRTGEIKTWGTYPEVYNGFKGINQMVPSRTFDGKRFIYSFPITPTLYWKNIDEQNPVLKTESNTIGMPLQGINTQMNVQDELNRYTLENPYYSTIAYDKWRDFLYRVVFLPINVKNLSTGGANVFADKPFKIQVFNSTFEFLGEKEFKGGVFDPKEFFITPAGLYISENNPISPNAKEDALQYRLIIVSK
ncbi:MAG: DUF4221 family protein [Saprospiraceae bacterium]